MHCASNGQFSWVASVAPSRLIGPIRATLHTGCVDKMAPIGAKMIEIEDQQRQFPASGNRRHHLSGKTMGEIA